MKEEIQDKRAAALKATLELIAEQGFHGTPMSQIAQRANIGVGTIYRYFNSKEDLINALYIDIKTRMTRYIFKNYSKDLPVREGFKQLLKDFVYYMIENPAELSFGEQYENSPLITAATREEGMRIAEPIEDLFKRAREQNLLKEMPIEILGTLLIGAIRSLAKLYLSGNVKFDEVSINEGIDAIWDMIKR
ncbi:MAG: TetR/AcrR family transcriptional regulator [Bacillota bacterium]